MRKNEGHIPYGREPIPTSPFTALSLCAPGAFCWFMLGWSFIFNLPLPKFLTFELFAAAWGVALVSAIISLVIYGRRPFEPKPWYVLVNLAINLLGLLYSIVLGFSQILG
jgi:hypothetical protein